MRDSTRTRMREREKKKSESESWGEGEREFIRNVTPQSCRSAGTQGDRQEFCQEFCLQRTNSLESTINDRQAFFQ